ncbi:unnamed protein product [Dovyalis caffra]|uniref:Uncharacterized protein n=1 Tax=Dovyalis caffra TaxID=77055 RepID=A0AAV1RC07_9ROSI|nr:unnamed protein product [Dovyalis caffra]
MNNQIDDSTKNQVTALLRVMNVTGFFKGDKFPCQIEEGLFLGSVGAATNKDALKSKNITHVLTVANSLPPSYPNDFVYKVIGVADRGDTNLRQYFNECFNFIDEAKRKGGGVLVHCFVGRSRSVTIVVAYLMKKHGMSLSEALAHVKSKRPQAGPNSGFISQLQDFEKSLQDQPPAETSMSHIAVERNRRRQMNEHLKVLRSLTPCFYIKRGDQASIIGGVIEFIKELHQVLQSLELKKQRKSSLSPSPGPCPSPSPRAPQQLISTLPPADQHSPFPFRNTENDLTEVGAACCNSPIADVEAKISGSNVILKIVSRRIPGQIVRIISVLEKFSFEVLHLNISSMEDTVLYSFVIKIGLECQLSVEELAVEVQQSFFQDTVYTYEI